MFWKKIEEEMGTVTGKLPNTCSVEEEEECAKMLLFNYLYIARAFRWIVGGRL